MRINLLIAFAILEKIKHASAKIEIKLKPTNYRILIKMIQDLLEPTTIDEGPQVAPYRNL